LSEHLKPIAWSTVTSGLRSAFVLLGLGRTSGPGVDSVLNDLIDAARALERSANGEIDRVELERP